MLRGRRVKGQLYSPESIYAAELGISTRRLRTLGGSAKLQSLAPEARATLLAQFAQHGGTQPRGKYKGGLKALGMLPCTPGAAVRRQEEDTNA